MYYDDDTKMAVGVHVVGAALLMLIVFLTHGDVPGFFSFSGNLWAIIGSGILIWVSSQYESNFEVAVGVALLILAVLSLFSSAEDSFGFMVVVISVFAAGYDFYTKGKMRHKDPFWLAYIMYISISFSEIVGLF